MNSPLNWLLLLPSLPLPAPGLFRDPSGDFAVLVLPTDPVQGCAFHRHRCLHPGHGLHGGSWCACGKASGSRWVFRCSAGWPLWVRPRCSWWSGSKGSRSSSLKVSWVKERGRTQLLCQLRNSQCFKLEGCNQLASDGAKELLHSQGTRALLTLLKPALILPRLSFQAPGWIFEIQRPN